MHMLSLIFSTERHEIHANMHKCLQKAYRYDQTNIQLRVSWIFDLIFRTTAIVDARNVG